MVYAVVCLIGCWCLALHPSTLALVPGLCAVRVSGGPSGGDQCKLYVFSPLNTCLRGVSHKSRRPYLGSRGGLEGHCYLEGWYVLLGFRFV